MEKKFYLLLLLLSTLFGCVTEQQTELTVSNNETKANSDGDSADVFNQNDLSTLSLAELSTVAKEEEANLNKILNLGDHSDQAAVQKWITYFTGPGHERFNFYLRNGLPYKATIQSILKRQGIPTYFYYLAMIESGYKVTAFSRAGAAGVWQFMSATGRRYGLRVNAEVDERRDPIRSTIAAAHFLSDLHNVFHSWFLALSAYNAGEMRILNAIMVSGTRDFWELCHKHSLPKETRDYVPQFIAATLIGNNPRKYGFTELADLKPPELIAVQVPSPVRLQDIADHLGMPLATLEKLNPHLRNETTPTFVKQYRVWIEKTYDNKVASLSELKPSTKFIARGHLAPDGSKNMGYYKIRKGDTLKSIARRFKTSVIALRKMNRLKGTKIVPGQKLMVSSVSTHRMQNSDG